MQGKVTKAKIMKTTQLTNIKQALGLNKVDLINAVTLKTIMRNATKQQYFRDCIWIAFTTVDSRENFEKISPDVLQTQSCLVAFVIDVLDQIIKCDYIVIDQNQLNLNLEASEWFSYQKCFRATLNDLVINVMIAPKIFV